MGSQGSQLLSQGSQEPREQDPEKREGKTHSAEKVLDTSHRCRKTEGVVNVGTDDNGVVKKEFAENVRSSMLECGPPHKCVLHDCSSAPINLANAGWVKTCAMP